jgi:hypothetical protein
MFVNLSNHPLSIWTGPQLDAARALGHGEPLDFPGGFPTVPAHLKHDEVQQLADTIIARVIAAKARAAAVFGEPTLTFALVSRLEALGLPCYAPTTDRTATERRDGDIVVKSATFEFVQWRRFAA